MIKDILLAIGSSARVLVQFWRALLIFILIYAAMLAAVYLFFATREATTAQLLLTLGLALIVPILFFLLQAMAVRFIDNRGHARTLMSGALRDFWKLLLISIPLIAIVGLVVYLLGEVKVGPEPAASIPPPPRAAVARPAQPLQWGAVAIVSLQYLLLYLVLPLALIHTWIATARAGLAEAIKTIGRCLALALAPRSVLTYVIGFVFFAVVPYFCLFYKTESPQVWLEISLLSARLLVAALFSLLGWVITVGALVELSGRRMVSSETIKAGDAISANDQVAAGQ